MVRVSTLPKEKCSKFGKIRVCTPNYNFFFFEIFKKDKHNKKADKILHFTSPPLRDRPLLKVL